MFTSHKVLKNYVAAPINHVASTLNFNENSLIFVAAVYYTSNCQIGICILHTKKAIRQMTNGLEIF
jgi:hypothetical protein